jgi:gluconolactonase
MTPNDASAPSAESLREVAVGLAFPEGPVVLPNGDLLVVEVRAGRLTRVAPDGTKEVIAELRGGPNGAAIGPDGAAYVVNNGGFAWSDTWGFPVPLDADGSNEPAGFAGGWIDRVDLTTREVIRLYDGFEGVPFVGPNDIVFDDAGGFWFTDFGKVRARTMDRGSVYYAKPDGSSIVRAADHLIGPNGIGLSPDGRRLVVAETYTGRLLGWDVAQPGELAGDPEVVVATPEVFDSLAFEADGSVVIGAMRGLCVVRPDRTWHVVELPDFMSTNVCFGGTGERTAYVTLSARGRLVAIDWPRPGHRLAY